MYWNWSAEQRVNLATSCCNASHLFTVFCGNQATWGRSENARMSLIFSRGFVDHDYDEEGGNWGVKNVFRLSDSSSSPFKPPTDAPFEKVEKFDSVVVDHCGRRHYCSGMDQLEISNPKSHHRRRQGSVGRLSRSWARSLSVQQAGAQSNYLFKTDRRQWPTALSTRY